MLRYEDERAIEDLFDRLERVGHKSGPRDVDAEALIRQKLAQNPAAAYYMAQAIIVQEAALREQQARLAELEEQAGRSGGGFLGSIFGDDQAQREPQVGTGLGQRNGRKLGRYAHRPGDSGHVMWLGASLAHDAHNASPLPE